MAAESWKRWHAEQSHLRLRGAWLTMHSSTVTFLVIARSAKKAGKLGPIVVREEFLLGVGLGVRGDVRVGF